MSQVISKPYRQVGHGSPVNPAGTWRFHCPQRHADPQWSTRKTIYCAACNAGYPIYEIVDLQSGLALVDAIADHGD